MSKIWQWFLKEGDKLLAWATAVAALGSASGLYTTENIPLKWITFALASMTMLHNTFLPDAKPAQVKPPVPLDHN